MLCVRESLRATLIPVLCALLATPCFAAEPVGAASTAYAAAIRSINPRIAPWQSRAYAGALLRDARALRVDPRLVMAVVTVESHWDAGAVSIHGAQGLGQLKPGTARELGVEPFSGRENLHGVTLYLHRLLGLFKSSRYGLREAIAGYNAGPYAVKSYGGIPPGPQTRRYVVKVLAALRGFAGRLSARVTTRASTAEVVEPIELVRREQAAYWGMR